MFEQDETRKKAKRLAVKLFLICICIALLCFGVFAYLLLAYRSGTLTGDRIVTVSKIIVMTGVFFLVLAFGYLLPVIRAHKKWEQE